MDWTNCQRYMDALHQLRTEAAREIDFAQGIREEPSDIESSVAKLLELRQELGLSG